MKTTLAFIAGAAALLGCGAEHSKQRLHVELPGSPVAVSEYQLGRPPPPADLHQYSGYTDPARLIIRSQTEWASAWVRINDGAHPMPPLPEVNFDTDMVVLAAAGTRPSGGFDITITDAALDAGALRVGVVETTPGAGCFVAAVITFPVAVARVARHDGPVEFVDATVGVPCG
jgi:hypothetical protein